MKTPFRKLGGLGLHKHDKQRSLAQLDELSQASQDMQDMKDCYDSLLSSAAATANSAYEFSESLREMGDCLLEKTSLNDHEDEDSGRVLLMLGKVQFEIQKLVDNYRSHISRTITVPSESLLNELRIVEDMKKQCDEKRIAYDDLKSRHKERRRLGLGFGLGSSNNVSSNEVRTAQQEFEEDATMFVFRVKSLKGGQSRSLLTQAARHHAAQMCFFRKALKSLEAIDPHVQLATQNHHIDYQFSGTEDDDRDSVFLTDDEDEDESDEDGELSFDYQRNQISSTENAMEVDLTFPQTRSDLTSIKLNLQSNMPRQQQRKPLWNSSTFNITVNSGSKSAPLNSSNIDRGEKSSGRKLNTYVLPTPLPRSNTQQPTSTTTNNNNNNYNNNNIWHSSPLDTRSKFSGPINNKRNIGPVVKHAASKRYAFSGPIGTSLQPNRYPGSVLNTRNKLLSGSNSFVIGSSPRISELHELPRPPKGAFSAPLVTSRNQKSWPLKPK